ncbi:hypothetical protein niasHT_012127 [Heterodera trifolii]|uniref:Uncharacterized protein n=1 Tax=Heterodera trifolii TaxID=157864 RepID=A0ABD2LAG8_9BILA
MKFANLFLFKVFILAFFDNYHFAIGERLYKEPPTTLSRYLRGQIWDNNDAVDYYDVEVIGDDVQFPVLETRLDWKDEKQFWMYMKLKNNTPILQVNINKMVTGLSVGFRATKETVHAFVLEAPNGEKAIDFTKYYAFDLTEQQIFVFPTFSALQDELERRKNMPTPEQILATLRQAFADLDSRLSEKLKMETVKLLKGIDSVLHAKADQHVQKNEKVLSFVEQARNAMLDRAKLMTSQVGKQVKDGLMLAFGRVVFTFV